MSLKLADKLVKQGDYLGALDAIAKAREQEPGNQYALAYEERVRVLIRQSGAPSPNPPEPLTSTTRANREQFIASPPKDAKLPSVEGQLNAIATPLLRKESRPGKPNGENRDAAILTKIASLLGKANEFLALHEYQNALEVISRATLLDPENEDILGIEQKIRLAQEDRQKRDHQDELQRIRREQEESGVQGGAARRSAQIQKAKQYLERTRDFLEAGQIQEAQCELAFVSVVDPANPEVPLLEREIERRRQEQQQQEMEVYRQGQEEKRKQEGSLRDEINQHMRDAEGLAEQGEFGEALRIILRSYTVDPSNVDLRACESRIVAAQQEWSQRTDAERRDKELSLQKQQESRAFTRDHARHSKELQSSQEAQDAKKKGENQKIFRLLKSAHEHISAGRYKEALSEVGVALLIDPAHEDVKRMEHKILEAQAHSAGRASYEISSPLSHDDDDVVETIAKHLAKAKRLASDNHYEQALEEVSMARVLDPSDDMIQRIEATIQEEAEAYKEEHSPTYQRPFRPYTPPPSSRRSSSSRRNGAGPAEGTEVVDQLIREQLDETAKKEGRGVSKGFRKLARMIAAVLSAGAVLTVLFHFIAPSSPSPRDRSERTLQASGQAQGRAGEQTPGGGPALAPASVAAAEMPEQEPKIIRLEEPKFAGVSLLSGIEEEVIVKVEISRQGTPMQARVIRSTNDALNDAVIDALLRSHYAPGTAAAGPVTAWLTVPYRVKT